MIPFYERERQRLGSALSLPSAYELSLTVDPAILEEGDPALDDMYVIDTTMTGGRILGCNERSVLQGVYRFFYNLGVRYLAPGRFYEWMPESWDRSLLQQQVTVRPGLRHRGVCIEGADSVENVLDMIDWLPKIGMNSFFVQFWTPYTFLQRWYEHIGNPHLPSEPLAMEQAEEYSQQIDEAMAVRGLLHHRVGHGWTGAVLGADAQGWDVQNREITEDQRRLVAQIDGKREFFGGIPVDTNLCYSSSEVRELFIQTVVDYARKHPEVQYLHLWLADNYNNHCECESCRQQIPTDHYIDLINGIDERLTAEHLDTRIVFLLYQELLWAPRTKKIRNPDRFVLMFAPISRSFESSYGDAEELPECPDFALNHVVIPVRVEENLAFLKAWQKQYTGDSFVYDYHLGRAHYGDLGYVHIARLIGRDLACLPSMGLNGYLSCQELRAGFPNTLPNYIMGLLGTDPSLRFEDVAEDYYRHAYGKSGHEILEYLTELSSYCSCDYFNGKGPRLREDLREPMKKALARILQFRGILVKCQGDNAIQRRFLRALLYHSYYSECMVQCLEARMAGHDDEVKAAYERLALLIETHEWDYQEFFDVYRIHEILKNYTKIG